MSYSASEAAVFNSRNAPKRVAKPVHFTLCAPEATTVIIIGDFNRWQPETKLNRQVDGCWHADVTLPHGHHRYIFLVDGERRLDPNGKGKTAGPDGEPVSLVAVS